MPGLAPGAWTVLDGAAFSLVETLEVAGAGATVGAGEGLLNWNHECLAGLGETVAEGAAAVVFFVVEVGDVAGAGVTEGEGVVEGLVDFGRRGSLAGVGETAAGDEEVTGAAASSFFLERLCFAGLGDAAGLALGEGEGDSAARAVIENATRIIISAINLFIPRPYRE